MSSNPEGSKASSKTAAGNSTSPGFLEKIDRYGYIPQLMYGGDTACKSQFGGFLTFGAGLCYVFLVCFTVYRYFERKSPSTSINQVFTSNPKGFILTTETMPFTVGLMNSNNQHFVDETIYTLEAYYTETVKSIQQDGQVLSSRSTRLPLRPCSQVLSTHASFSSLDLQHLYCLDLFKPSDSSSLSIRGRAETGDYTNLQIKFKRCNPTDNKNCRNNQQIDSALEKAFFAIYYLDRVTELSNFEAPISKFQNSIVSTCSPHYTKYLFFSAAVNAVETDSSLAGYTTADRIEFVSTGSWRNDIAQVLNSGYPENFFVLDVKVDPIQRVFFRKYKNVYDYLIEFGGITQVILITGFLLTFRYSETNLMRDLAAKTIQKERMYQYVLGKKLEENEDRLKASELDKLTVLASPVAENPSQKITLIQRQRNRISKFFAAAKVPPHRIMPAPPKSEHFLGGHAQSVAPTTVVALDSPVASKKDIRILNMKDADPDDSFGGIIAQEMKQTESKPP